MAIFITLSMGANDAGLALAHPHKDGEIKSEEQTKVSHVEKTANGLRFEMLDRVLSTELKGAPRSAPFTHFSTSNPECTS